MGAAIAALYRRSGIPLYASTFSAVQWLYISSVRSGDDAVELNPPRWLRLGAPVTETHCEQRGHLRFSRMQSAGLRRKTACQTGVEGEGRKEGVIKRTISSVWNTSPLCNRWSISWFSFWWNSTGILSANDADSTIIPSEVPFSILFVFIFAFVFSSPGRICFIGVARY